MAKTNFFLVNRSILDHWLWEDKPFSKGQAWIDLMALANYKDKKIERKGRIVSCKRGEVNMSVLSLSKRWGWTRGRTERFLKLLESDGMVKKNSTTDGTTLTIENYNIYQDLRATDDTTNEQQTDNRQTTNEQQTDTTKERKRKKKKDNNIYITPALGEFKNVSLSEEELEKLKERFPYDWQKRIERLSQYMKSRGKRYKSHYATILNWAENEENDVKSEKNNGHEEPYRTSEKDYSAYGSGFRT